MVPGAEKSASRRIGSKGVHQAICKLDWNAHGRTAPPLPIRAANAGQLRFAAALQSLTPR